MSGGFFRGTSADQDTRFSNKQAKLLKNHKFAPELDHLVDASKVKMDVIRPWIATRATELLGFEDEVLINFVYGLLDVKVVNGKNIQIQLTGFMEKNTGKFMRELWALLLSAQNNSSGIPQQFLDAKEEEINNKKMEDDRITQEIQRTKEKGRLLEEERYKRMDEESGRAGSMGIGPGSGNSVPRDSSNDTREEKDIEARKNLRIKSRGGRKSRSNSVSSKSASRSPSPKKRYNSSSRRSISPTRHSISPCRKYSLRDTSPLRRRSPNTRRRSPSVSRHRSPSPHRRSPYLQRRSPPFAQRKYPSPSNHRSPPFRRRSPSPLRRRSPPFRRRSPSPLRRRSPIRRRSPHRSSPPHRRFPSPFGRRSPPMRHLSSPMRRSPLPVRQRSPYQRNKPSSQYISPTNIKSLSPAGHKSSSPMKISPVHRSAKHQNRSPLYSPKRHGGVNQISPYQRKRNRSPSKSSSPPYRQHMRSDPDTANKTNGFDAKRHQDENTPERTCNGRSPDPQNRVPYPSTNQSHSISHSPSHVSRYKKDDKDHISHMKKAPSTSNSQGVLPRANPRENRSFLGSPDWQSGKQSREDKQATPDRKETYMRDDSFNRSNEGRRLDKNEKSSYAIDHSPEVYSPDGSVEKHDYATKDQQKSHKDLAGHAPAPKDKSLEVQCGPERTRDKYYAKDDSYGGELNSASKSKKKIEPGSRADSSDLDFQDAAIHRHHGKEKISYNKHDKHKRESDSDTEVKREAKKKRKEERRLRKEEKHRKREERHWIRLEHRADKMKSNSIDTVTPPREHEMDDNGDPKSENEASVRKGSQSAAEFDQERLEIELRAKALETLRAKKCVHI